MALPKKTILNGIEYTLGTDNIITTVVPGSGGRQQVPVTDPNIKTQVYRAFGLDSNGRALTATAPATTGSNAQAGTGTTTINDLELNLNLKLNQTNLSYPKTFENKQTYVRFTSYDFSELQKSNQIYNPGDLGRFLGEGLSGIAARATSSSIGEITYSKDIINLYVPPGINVSYGANWGEASLGAIGSQRSANSLDTGSLLDSILAGAGRFLGAGNESLIRLGIDKISSTLEKVPGYNAQGEDIFGLLTGLVFNENKFSTFNNISLRTFDYSFIMVARSKEEKEEINRIINVFKIAMHPAGLTLGYKGTATPSGSTEKFKFGAVARPPLLKYPKLWTIEYFVGKDPNRFIPKTKFCAITNLNINYTPNSAFTTLTDGAIPAIQMDISFRELTPLFADEILDPSVAGNAFGETANSGLDENYNNKSRGTF